MRFKIQVTIVEDDQKTTVEDIITFEKDISNVVDIGLSLSESKQILKKLQGVII